MAELKSRTATGVGAIDLETAFSTSTEQTASPLASMSVIRSWSVRSRLADLAP
jgi:hypothetical protein